MLNKHKSFFQRNRSAIQLHLPIHPKLITSRPSLFINKYKINLNIFKTHANKRANLKKKYVKLQVKKRRFIDRAFKRIESKPQLLKVRENLQEKSAKKWQKNNSDHLYFKFSSLSTKNKQLAKSYNKRPSIQELSLVKSREIYRANIENYRERCKSEMSHIKNAKTNGFVHIQKLKQKENVDKIES